MERMSKSMKEKMIRLNEAKDVREFVSAAEKCDFDINVICRHVFIDGKSFLGMLGLLMNDLKVSYAGDDQKFDSIVQKYAIA